MTAGGRDGEVHVKRVFCADLEVGQSVREVFCLGRVERREGKRGPFLRLTLVDRSGRVAGVAWDEVDALLEVLVEGSYARIEGEVGDWRGEPQVKVTAAEPAGRVDPADFLPRGPVDGETSLAAIRRLVGTMTDLPLKALVESFLDDADFARAFTAAPAAMIHHHAYVGGLAEHTLSVMELCAAAAEHYDEVDRDLLLAGALFHDLGKVDELSVEPGFPYTEEGVLLGHIPLGFARVREAIGRIEGFPAERATDLGHLILSHQGELEWGSPVQPRTLEAIVLHFLDNLDSKAATARTHLAEVESGRTSYVKALGRSLFRRGPAGTPGDVQAPAEGPGRAEDAAPEPPTRTGGGPDAGEGGTPSLFDELDPSGEGA